MTKFSTSRTFEAGKIAGTRAYQEMEPFVDFENGITENLIRFCLNGVGIKDNMDGEMKEVVFVHNEQQSVRFRKKPLRINFDGPCENMQNYLAGIPKWQPTDGGLVIITCRFEIPITNNAPTRQLIGMTAYFS